MSCAAWSCRADSPTAEAALAGIDLQRLNIELFPFAPFAPRIWELRHTVTCYDAWYVALAEALDCPLATLGPKAQGRQRAGVRVCGGGIGLGCYAASAMDSDASRPVMLSGRAITRPK